MFDDKKILEICEIICRTLEGNETKQNVQYLDQMIREHSEILKLYNYITQVQAQLMCPGQSQSLDLSILYGDKEFELLRKMLEGELNAPTCDMPKKLAPVSEPVTIVTKSSQKRYLAFIASIAAVLMIVITAYFNQKSTIAIATVKDSYQTKWKAGSLIVDQRLARTEHALELFSGLVKLELDNGAEVVIEGPASFSLLSPDSMQLSYGKLSSLVPPAAAGFRVDTPGMTVTDLGTEFTIEVGEDGVGTVNLYTGRAVLMAGIEGHRIGTDVLSPGQARKVDHINQKVIDVDFDTVKVARSFSSKTGFVWYGQPVDLAAVIAGADLFSTVTGIHGIDPHEGSPVNGYRYKLRKSTGKYKLVDDNRYIDGVFIPDSDLGDNIISSQGHIFENCPDTAGVREHNSVGENSHDIITFCDYDSDDVTLQPYQLPNFKSITAGTLDIPAVLIHSNGGLTFDLDAIRKDLQGLDIKQFISSFGLPDIDTLIYADARVTILIDGKTRYLKENLVQEDGLVAISIDIADSDRFLTIAVTDNQENVVDNKGAIDNDYVYLVSPQLQLTGSY